MRRLREAWHVVRSLWRRDDLERGLTEEIRFHLDQQTEKNLRAGMTPEEARRQALLRFGAMERTREGVRDEFRLLSLEDLVRDFRHGTRALRRTPGFAVAAVLTLALGIGAATAMFSVVHGVLLRPLPYPGQDRLVELVHEAPGLGIRELFASPAIYFTYRDHGRAFESVGLWDWDSSPATVTGAGEPESVPSVEVTHDVLPMLGAHPVLGRTFTEADDRPGAAPTVVVSHGYWRRRFGGSDPLARTLIVDGVPRQVIGVLPPSFRFFEYPAEIFYPLQPSRSEAVFPSFDGRGIARLKPGVTLREANADVAQMIPIMMEAYGQPGVRWDQAGFGPVLRPLKASVVGHLTDSLWLLMGTIGLLLVIACANVSNLVLVRTQARRSELAIRTAIGAGWAALARVVIAESALLGLSGGAAGVAIAYLTLPLLRALAADDLPQVMTVAVDRTVLLAAVGISVLAALIVALIPVFHLALPRARIADALRGDGRAATAGREGTRTRHLLVVAQVAIALVLLAGSGLMIRTFVELRRVDPGFRDPDSVLTFQLTLPARAADDAPRGAAAGPEGTLRLQQAVMERLASMPGVDSAAFSAYNDGLPLDGDGRSGFLVADGGALREGASRELQFVSPFFFDTLGTPLLAGRGFEWADVYQTRAVALVSENLARVEWGSARAALGKRVSLGRAGGSFEVVGVVKDVHHSGLSRPAPQVAIFPAASSDTASFVIRGARVGTPGFVDDVRQAIWSVNANLSPANVRTLGDLYRRSMARTTMTLQLLAVTGVLALALGLVGVSGVVSYAVAQRRREIGIRLALGARRAEVRWMFVRQALVLVGTGVAIGLCGAAALSGLMESQLFGVSPLDPATHAAIAGGLVATAGLAGFVSARRASALDPVEVLRAE